MDKDEAELPKHLCDVCVQKLLEFETFRKSCVDQQIKLRKCLNTSDKNGDEAEGQDGGDKFGSEDEDDDDDDEEDMDEDKPLDTSVESGSGDGKQLPELSDPTPDDYVLMREEAFQLNPAQQYIVAKNAFPCSLCGECFEFDQGKSRLSDSDEKNKLYDCHVCGKVFPRRGSWRRHLSTHENIKPYVCRDHLREHLSTHGTSRPFSCDSCKKQFVRNEHLARHKLCSPSCSGELASIDVVRPFQCDVCNQGFVRKEHLVRHRKRAHDLDPPEGAEAKPFSCSVCGKTFTRREHLRRHQQIHARELLQSSMDMSALTGLAGMGGELQMPLFAASLMPEISMSSGGSGNSSPRVKKEGDDGSEDPMEVELPPPEASSSPLNRPAAPAALTALGGIPLAVREKLMRPVIPRERPPKPIPKCDVCKKVFSRRSHLLRHLKRLHNIDPPPGRHLRPDDENHNKQQQYECVTCGEAFTESEKLNQHMETHGNTIMNNFIWM
ncbi:hypothetical protein M8J76_016075 [Diaphorina citri]|nr:hypothetical protein M8J76_016075 [Diaphorina citri]